MEMHDKAPRRAVQGRIFLPLDLAYRLTPRATDSRVVAAIMG